MRVRLVIAHPVASLAGDRREGEIALALRARGHDAAVFRSMPLDGTADPGRYGDAACFFPIDAPAADHDATSAALMQALEAAPPDALLVKGVEYALIRQVVARWTGHARLVAIIGGMVSDPQVTPRLDHVFTEYEGQIGEAERRAMRMPPDEVLPKFVDWAAVASAPTAERDIDIVNVGNFFEERKNQEILFPLLRRHSACLIGDGDRLRAFRALTRHYEPAIHYPGQVPAGEVFAWLKRARLMVHTSRWEGFPRVIAEALACGTPVVAFSEGVGGGIDPAWGARADEASFVRTVQDLLADPARLAEMGAAARAHAEATFTLGAIVEKVERVLSAD